MTDQESSDRPALGHRGEKNGKQATKITSELGGFGSPMVIVFTATITCSVVIVIPLGIRILRGLLVAGWLADFSLFIGHKEWQYETMLRDLYL